MTADREDPSTGDAEHPDAGVTRAGTGADDAAPDPVARPDAGPALTARPAVVPGPTLSAALEALLLVTDQPVTTRVLAELVELPAEVVLAHLHALVEEYDAHVRGFELRDVAGGWRLYTRAEHAELVERFLLDGQQARLTQAALETLAVIAYRQPVTRQRISAVRGVNVDGVVRTLAARGLVEDAGPDAGTGAATYRTTRLFLERLGLPGLEALPSLAPLLPELDELDAG